MEEPNQKLAQEQAAVAMFEIPPRPNLAQVDYEDPQALTLASATLSQFRRHLRALSTNRQIFEQLERDIQSQVLEDIQWAATELDELGGEMKRLSETLDLRQRAKTASGTDAGGDYASI
jgi:hypothetical protein